MTVNNIVQSLPSNYLKDLNLSDSGEIERILTIMPDGKILEITPDENPKIRISSNEEVTQQNGTDTNE